MGIVYFVILNLVVYLPFHLFEEAIGDFPRWMYEHKWLPYHMTHGHWMANNLFIYYPMVLLSASIFAVNKNLACFGVAVLIWGVINFGDHFFYTIKDRKISPGLITGVLFLVNSIFGLRAFVLSDLFSVPHLVAGTIIGGILFGLSIGLCVAAYKFFDKYIK